MWNKGYKGNTSTIVLTSLTDAIKHTDISGTSELVINGMELLHNLQHCSQALMYTIHTCYTPALAVSGTSWASWCVHFHPLSVCCWRFSASLTRANFCWGRRTVVGKYSAGIMHLCRGCKEADYPWKQFVHLKTASSLYMWHNLVHFPYLCPRPPERNNLSWLTILIPVINTSTCKWHICNYLLLYSYSMCTSNLHDRAHFANN